MIYHASSLTMESREEGFKSRLKTFLATCSTFLQRFLVHPKHFTVEGGASLCVAMCSTHLGDVQLQISAKTLYTT